MDFDKSASLSAIFFFIAVFFGIGTIYVSKLGGVKKTNWFFSLLILFILSLILMISFMINAIIEAKKDKY